MPSEDNKTEELPFQRSNHSLEKKQEINGVHDPLASKPEVQFSSHKNDPSKPFETALELHEIPLPEFEDLNDQEEEAILAPRVKQKRKNENMLQENTSNRHFSTDKGISLPEIMPQPYQGSLLSSKKASGVIPTAGPTIPNMHHAHSIPKVKPLPFSKSLKNETSNIKTSEKLSETIKNENEPIHNEISNYSIHKQKQIDLENDMIEVLKVLSKKLSISRSEITGKDLIFAEEKLGKKIQPASLNEVLKSLLKMNNHVEAASLLKTDGTILAAAISTRISESLFGTIAQNLAMIGTDIVHGLSAGDLESISIRGTEGVLDLAPLDRTSPLVKDMMLMIFSNPKVRSGVIFFAVKNIEKLIIEYLES